VYARTSCSRSWLERHVLSHGGNKPFRCIVDGCGQRFSSQVCAFFFYVRETELLMVKTVEEVEGILKCLKRVYPQQTSNYHILDIPS
jgi:hypothetical protein